MRISDDRYERNDILSIQEGLACLGLGFMFRWLGTTVLITFILGNPT